MSKNQKIIGYIRVSTIDQDTEKNKNDILRYANNKGFDSNVEFVEEKVSGLKSWKNRKLADTVDELKKDDILIVPELSRLGRSLRDILDVLNTLTEKDVKVYSVKENSLLNDQDITSKITRTMLALFAEIESDLISQRTKEGLAEARKKGVKLGRPKGSGKSKLDKYEDEILNLLENGSTKKFVAEKYGVTPPTLHHWLNTNGFSDI